MPRNIDPSRRLPRVAFLAPVLLLAFGPRLAAQDAASKAAEIRKQVEQALGSISDATGVSVSNFDTGKNGDDFVASARVAVLGKSAKLRVTLQDKTKPRQLQLDFGAARLDLARLAAPLGGAFASVLPASLGGDISAGIRLHEIRLLRDVEAKTLESVEVAFSPEAKTSWKPIRALQLRVDDLRIVLTALHPKQADKREVRGSLVGTLRAGSKFSCSVAAKLGKSSEDFELEAQLANRWRLRDLAAALGGDRAQSTLAPLPDILENAALRDATLALLPASGLAKLRAKSNFGQLELLARDKGVLIGIAPPKDFRLAQIDASLRSLDANELALDEMSLVISSFDGEVDSKLAGSTGRGRVRRGLNLAARLDLRPLKLDRMLRVQTLDLRAHIPYPEPMNLVLAAAIQAQISLGKNAVFREVQLRLRPNPKRFKLALQGRMDLDVDKQKLGLLGEFAVEPLTQSVSGTFALDPKDGEWRAPFGIRGVAVPKLAVSLGATFGTGIPLPTFGMQAGLRIGAGAQAISGNGAVVLNPRDPMHSMIACDVRQLSLMRIVGLAAPQSAARITRSPLAKALKALQIRNAALRIVPQDIDFAGSTFHKGYRIAGDFNVLGVNAKGLFEIDYSRGITARATMDALRLAGGALEITGARGRRNPILALDLRTDRQSMLVNGTVRILGKFFVGSTDLHITPSQQSLFARGKLFGKLQAELEVTAATSIAKRSGDYMLRARMEQSLLADLRKRVTSEIDRATRKHVHNINKAKANVAKAQRDVQAWDAQIAATRRRVSARQAKDIANMKAAAKRSRVKADREFKRLGGKISSLKKRIKKQPWRAADLGAQIAVLETRRRGQRLLLKTIGANLVKGLAQLGKKFPKELSSELGPMLAAQKTAQGSLIAAQGVLSGYRGVVKGSMGAAKWIAKNGLGNAFDLQGMQLETRLATARGASFACGVRGRFLGKDFQTQLRLRLDDPARIARDLAKALLDGKAPKRAFRSVSIRRRPTGRLAPPRALPAMTTKAILQASQGATPSTR